MPEPPRFARRPIACPRCGLTRDLAAAPHARLRCPQCRYEYPAPDLRPPAPAAVPAADPAPPVAPAHQLPPPAGGAGPRVVDVAAVTIRPAPAPEPGTEPPAPLTPSGPGVPSVMAAKTDAGANTAGESREVGLPAARARTFGRDRRPIRRPQP